MSEERGKPEPHIHRRGEFLLSGELGRWQVLGRLFMGLWRRLFPRS